MMKLPGLTAEFSLGPPSQEYASAAALGGDVAGQLTTMDFFSDITGSLGSVFGGILTKIPCLLGCGIPNAVEVAGQCGFDPVCWVTRGGSAGFSCISQCLR